MYTLIDENKTLLNITDNTVLIFLDETGHEELRDPNYPIFGYGGCMLPAKLYSSNIVNPWDMIKKNYFNMQNKPLHAADLNRPTPKQLEAMNRFFSTFEFGRFAAVITDKSINNSNADFYHIMAGAIYKRIEKILSVTSFTDIVMIFESSQRTDTLMSHFFSQFKFMKDNAQGVPIQHYIMDKKQCEAGLEVADFIVQCAGTTCRSRLQGRISTYKERKDFMATFGNIDRRLSEFIEINRIDAKETPKNGGNS